MDKNDCIFCKINDSNSEETAKQYNRHIIDTKAFFMVAGRGQLCNGYSILCSRAHVHNLSMVPAEQWTELTALKKRINKLVYKLYGCHPVYFEHGDADGRNRGGSCISHAHLHMVPTALYKLPHFIDKSSIVSFESESEARCYMRKNSPYFYLELSDRKMFVLNSQHLPCQFGRQLLYKELQLPGEWDWRLSLDAEAMIKTIRDYEEALKGNENNAIF